MRAASAPGHTDRELLAQFARGDQGAFEVLVKRHTGLVLGVCRRALPTPQDAEDACQAVFLILARKAHARWQPSVANWLFTTARRVSADVRRSASRRAGREARTVPVEPPSVLDQMTGREVLAALDEELDRLPAIYREPLVLCHLEGLTRDEAAARLGVPLATLKSQLDRGRKRLADALTRRGVALGAGLLAVTVPSPAGACPPRLVESVLAAVSGTHPAPVGELIREGTVTVTLGHIKLAVAGVFGLIAVGFALAVPATVTQKMAPGSEEKAAVPAPKVAPQSEPVKGATVAAAEEKETKSIAVKGVVLGPDDKPVAGAKLFLHSRNQFVPAPQPIAAPDGTFAFSVDEHESGEVVATAPGCGVALRSVGSRPLPARTLRLTPDEPVRGKVIDLEGKPVAGVHISVVTVVQPHADKTLDRWLKAGGKPKDAEPFGFEWLHDWQTQFAGLLAPVTTDREGKFEIRGVGRDRVAILRVSSPTTVTQQVNVVTRKVERFEGNASLIGINTPAAFHGCDPVVVAAPVPATRGRVTDAATGEPVPGSVLYVANLVQQLSPLTGLGMSVKVVADKDGRFALPGLPRGAPGLSVIVFPPNGAPYHRVSVAVPDGAAERAAFDVKLTRGVPATVKIVDKTTGKPVAGSLRYGVFPDANPNVKAVPTVWHNFAWTDDPYVAPAASELRIVVFPGKGLLAAQTYSEDRSYRSGVGVEVFEKYRTDDQLLGLVSAGNIHVRQWQTFAEIDVPVGAKEFTCTLALDRGVRASGRLVGTDGKPVTGAQSYGLENEMGASGGWAQPATDATFTARALRPGEQRRVMFVHVGRKLAGTAVVVGGSKEPTEVRMEPWGEVTGRLVSADGEPVTGELDLSWDVIRQDDLKLGSSPLIHPGRGGLAVGADGRFRITGLVPGLTYKWTASGPQGASATLPDTVPKSGEPTDLGDIRLSHEGP
ncbi:sigma-70 family RNA polymerase sigma factor [Frigoriglobus tundricola]|nr:sigma-70 family RNA polymerase sigma factor [Frigoriglobus tundricola]